MPTLIDFLCVLVWNILIFGLCICNYNLKLDAVCSIFLSFFFSNLLFQVLHDFWVFGVVYL